MKIEGVDGVVQVLNHLPRSMARNVLDAAVRNGGQHLRREIVARAPIGPDPAGKLRRRRSRRGDFVTVKNYGKLRGNIRVSKVKGAVGRFVVHVGRAFWARFLEFGTKKMRPRPFMRPAFDAGAADAAKAIAEGLGKGLDAEGRRLARRYGRGR